MNWIEPPNVLRGSLRARRTLFEGFMLALAKKTGRRPSLVERSADHAMDAAESELTFGKPAFKIALMSALFVERNPGHRQIVREIAEVSTIVERTAARPSFSPLFRFEQGKGLIPTGNRPMRSGFRATDLNIPESIFKGML